MARGRTVSAGRSVTDRGLVRGSMIVLTEDEWRSRFEEATRKVTRLVLVVTGVAIVGILIVPAILTMGAARIWPFIAPVAVVMGLVYLFSWAILVLVSRWVARRPPFVGLYEGGVQITRFLFIPYFEIASVEEKTLRLGPFKREFLVLRPAHKPSIKVRFTAPYPWTLDMGFVGDEGAEELGRRVRGEVAPKGPPKLVIYGPRSSGR